MSINFQTFLDKTGYTAPYAARSVLYYPKSRPALLAVALDLDVKGERLKMIQIVAGKESIDTPVQTSSRSPKAKSAPAQLEIMDSCPSPAKDTSAAGEAA